MLGFADPMFAGQIARLRAGLVLAQNRDDLFSVNRFRFICPSFDQGPDSNSRWRKNLVAGQ